MDGQATDDNAPDIYPLDDLTLARRVIHSGRVRSKDKWEVLRPALSRMIMQGMSNALIAEALDTSPRNVERWRAWYFTELRRQGSAIEPRDFAMERLVSLRAALAEAWTNYRQSAGAREKAVWHMQIMRAEEQLRQFGTSVGLYGGRGEKPLDGAAYGEERQDPGAAEAKHVLIMLARLLDPRTMTEDMGWRVSDGGLLITDASGTYDDLFAGVEDECPDAEGVAPGELPPSPPIAPVFNVRRRRRPCY